MSESAAVASLLAARLVMVTGKGGTGKTTIAAALALLAATRGRRVLLCELDVQRPGTTAIFGQIPAHAPAEVRPNLFVSNIGFRDALAAFIKRVVPGGRVVRLVLDNPLVRRFIDVTPGSRELVLLARIGELRGEYDLVVVDMPASGHAFSLLDILRSAIGLFRTGPLRRVAQELREILHDDLTHVVFCALPEEMVVNETLETYAKMKAASVLGGASVVICNRATAPSLTEPERTLIARLADRELTALQREFVQAGGWESELEQGTAEATARLGAAFGAPPVLVPPSGAGGVPARAVYGVAVHLGRAVGMARRDVAALDEIVPPATSPSPAPAPVDLADWLGSTELIVCVGSGGAGKTTTAAAIGLWSALQGDRTLVVTVDPARRLANSLGLAGFAEDETRIDVPSTDGELWAVMVDSRKMFDSVIKRVAPTAEVRDRVLRNRIYRHMADTFAGSHEYMATEKLFDAMRSGRYDRIVLDTPPVKNALDFLESPGRLINFLDERVLRWFLHPPPRGVRRLVGGTSSVLYFLLGQVFGTEFIDELGGFFRDFEGMYEGFRTRHEAVVEKLRAKGTFFVTVCAATDPSVDVAVFFEQELAARGLPRGGIVINQVHHADATEHDAAKVLGDLARSVGADLPGATVPGVLARLGMAHRRLHELSVAERAIEARLGAAAGGAGFLVRVPRMAGQVHDLGGLRLVGDALFRPAP